MNPETIQVVVFDGLPINVHLLEWVQKFPNFTRASDVVRKPYPDLVGMWRNMICDSFLKATDLTHILMLDADMVPLPETKPIWSEDAPVMGCDYIGSHSERAHDGPGYIGCGCMRISREALEVIPRPWFDFVLKDDGLGVERCECGHFCEKAMAAGLHPVKRGKMGHIMEAVVSPSGKEQGHIQLLSRWGKDR